MTGPDGSLPRYEAPRLALLSFGVSLLLGRRRSFAQDSRTVLDANPHLRRIEGAAHVPAEGPFVLVMNHFSRRGLRPYHCAMIVSAAIADARPGQPELRWAFTSEYLGLRWGPVPVPLSLIRWAFHRVALVYGFVTIPRREELVVGRAAALRHFRRILRDGSPVALTPEGAAVGAHGRLVEPPEGSGLFVAMLARGAVPVVPAGIFETGGALHVRFGAPFELPLTEGAPRDEQDRLAKRVIMTAIGAELPVDYRGVYADAVDAHQPPGAL
jgi:hypothetical protein